MPVWGLWDNGAFWFSSSRQSRKARNLANDPRCVVTTENAVEPVVVEGLAEVVTDPETLTRMLALENAKYQTDYSIDLLDPAVNAAIRVRPRWAFGLAEGDFTGSPTRWILRVFEIQIILLTSAAGTLVERQEPQSSPWVARKASG
jgi:hypothetical protein